ncbi:hypothetical protein K2173_019112 [Erythroxylum novogranatense]|uniref:Uncharacterized protein n=1 Tax=Erythroxylum novogranatense TaxID=1862640 RepID=A0AAV8STH5_9ROSI|nr:hypothetical protein K2173_019112 [Erythroxylum novogranatense]
MSTSETSESSSSSPSPSRPRLPGTVILMDQLQLDFFNKPDTVRELFLDPFHRVGNENVYRPPLMKILNSAMQRNGLLLFTYMKFESHGWYVMTMVNNVMNAQLDETTFEEILGTFHHPHTNEVISNKVDNIKESLELLHAQFDFRLVGCVCGALFERYETVRDYVLGNRHFAFVVGEYDDEDLAETVTAYVKVSNYNIRPPLMLDVLLSELAFKYTED